MLRSGFSSERRGIAKGQLGPRDTIRLYKAHRSYMSYGTSRSDKSRVSCQPCP
jgi:hypothetical protein